MLEKQYYIPLYGRGENGKKVQRDSQLFRRRPS
jgi:hypothetical protein